MLHPRLQRSPSLIRRVAPLAAVLAVVVAAPAAAQTPRVNPANPLHCDPIDPAVCMLPFPNDFLTVRDESTPTGRRIDFNVAAMPRNVAGVPVDPTDYNRADGFSPGQLIVTKVPGLDTPQAFENTGAVPITDIARTYDTDAPIVVINARTLERHLIWSELDVTAANPEDVTLLIRPAVNFEEGERYIVALRNLKDSDGNPIEAQPAFRAIRDGEPSGDAAVEDRRAHLNGVMTTLEQGGIAREDLYLAWDFTVASRQSLAGRMLHIRNDAFELLGDTNLEDMVVEGRAPDFVVTGVEDFTPEQNPRVRRRIEGRVIVPCYLDQPGCPTGSSFVHGPNGMPVRNPANFQAASVVCNIPHRAADEPGRAALYGHGLLGEAASVDGVATRVGSEHNITFCATDWSGMAFDDIPNVATILAEMGRFKTLADRGQQGMLNFLYLGRWLIHPEGAITVPEFQIDGKPVIDIERLHYYGGSQGGIMGGALTAVAPDFDRAVLGVPGMNYSTLLSRSVDWGTGKGPDPSDPDIPEYAWANYQAYPNQLERQLLFSLIQMLWDRAESNGYAQHMTDDAYPNTPPHEVLLSMAYGDHQVTNWATMVMARTVGASVREPILDPGRSNEVNPFYGIPRFSLADSPFAGSALTVWDVGPLRTEDGRERGTTPPPPENIPNDQGVDPHGPDASETVPGRLQYSEFMKIGGKVVDTCGTAPCYLDGWTGPGP